MLFMQFLCSILKNFEKLRNGLFLIIIIYVGALCFNLLLCIIVIGFITLPTTELFFRIGSCISIANLGKD
jgi:hypothetical protein